MSKMPIDWHEQCLRNQTQAFQLRVKRHNQDAVDLEEWKRRIEFSQRQIDEAKRRGMTEYDQDRLLVKRGKK